jgi:Rrf2 family protein
MITVLNLTNFNEKKNPFYNQINYKFVVIKYLNIFMSKLFNLSDAASIAIHAMVLVAKHKEGINVIKIAELTNTSKHHVAKVMQRLAKDGLVNSQRGPLGGFALKKEASEVTFLDIYESIEGKIEVTHCVFNTPICPLEHCIMNNITSKISNEFIAYLKSQSLDKYV